MSHLIKYLFSFLENSSVLKTYMKGEALSKDTQSIMLACFLVYRSIPYLKNAHTQLEGKTNIRSHETAFVLLHINIQHAVDSIKNLPL